MKGYFRETCKSPNINLITQTPKFTVGIIQIISKSILTILLLNSIQIYLYVPFQYLTLQPDPEVRGVCKVKVVGSMLVYITFLLI